MTGLWVDNPSKAGSSVTITRPSNTTAYSSGAVVGDTNGSAIIKFANVGAPSNVVTINTLNFSVYVGALPTGMYTFTLYLFNSAPDAIADGAIYSLSSAGDRSKYLSSIDLAIPKLIGGTLMSQNNDLAIPVKLADNSADLYGLLVTNGAFTPTSGAVKVLTLFAS